MILKVKIITARALGDWIFGGLLWVGVNDDTAAML
jgi:hypothetical protein